MKNIILIAARDGAVSQLSGVADLGDLHRFAVQVTFTGTLAGTLTLQASLDKVVWVDVKDSDQVVAAGDSHIWDVQSAGYQYVRASWAYASGAGTIACTIHIKEPIE